MQRGIPFNPFFQEKPKLYEFKNQGHIFNLSRSKNKFNQDTFKETKASWIKLLYCLLGGSFAEL